MPRGRSRAEVYIHGCVGVDDNAFGLVTETGELLVGLQHRAGLVVVEDKGPEVLRRDVRWQMDLVGLAAVERFAFAVHERGGVLRADAHHLRGHRRRDAGRVVEKEGAGVEVAHAGLGEELVAAADEALDPGAVREEVGLLEAGPEQIGARGGVTHGHGLGEDFLHARIGSEWLAFFDADGGQKPERFRVQRRIGFFLHDVVDLLEEREVVCMNRVERLAGDIDELHRRRVVRLRQWIDLGKFLGALDGRFGVAVDQETAPEEDIAESGGAENEVALGHIAFVAGRQQQEFPALALVRAGVAHIADIIEPVIVDDPENVRRRLDDQRAILQVQPHHAIDGFGVRREEQRLRIHQRLHDKHGLVVGALAAHAFAHGIDRRARHGVEEGLHATREVEVVVNLLDGGVVREAVEELQRAQPGFDGIRRGDRRRNVRRHLHLRRGLRRGRGGERQRTNEGGGEERLDVFCFHIFPFLIGRTIISPSSSSARSTGLPALRLWASRGAGRTRRVLSARAASCFPCPAPVMHSGHRASDHHPRPS